MFFFLNHDRRYIHITTTEILNYDNPLSAFFLFFCIQKPINFYDRLII